MKLLLSSCAIAALVVGVAGRAEAQVAVGAAPIHAIPASDAQTGPVVNGPAAAVAAPVAPSTPAAQPLVVADASSVRPASASENTLIASLTPPKPAPAALTEDETAFFSALGHRITDDATAYDGYVRHAEAINPGFSDAASVQRAVKSGADYQPQQLQHGLVAYAAMIALRSPAFVEGVRAQAATDPALADRLTAQPAAVLQIQGAQQAVLDVDGVLHAHGIALTASGKAIAKAAYDIQAQPWSKTPVASPVEVLAGVKASAAQARVADAPSEKALLHSLVSEPRGEAAGAPSATPAVVRGMAIAALAVMGHAGDKEDLRMQTLLQEAIAADCLKMAQLNMDQCLAAAGPHYDDVFCVGEHAVGETARCVSKAADGEGPAAPDPGLRVAAAETEAGQAYGPEQAAAYGYTQSPAAGGEPSAEAGPPAVAQADAPAYPAGDGTLNGQVYARRAQQAQQAQAQPQAAPTAPAPAPVQYASQSAPPPAYAQPAYAQPGYGQPPEAPPAYQQPAYQQQAPQQGPYGYYGQGGGYAPYGGYYAPPQAYAEQGYYPYR